MGGVSRGPSSKSPVWGALDPLSGGRGSFLELLSLASGGTPGPPGSQAEVEVQRALTLISPFLVGLGRRPWHLFSGSSVPSLEAGSKVPYHREAPGSENPQTTFSTFPGGEWVCGLGGAQADGGGGEVAEEGQEGPACQARLQVGASRATAHPQDCLIPYQSPTWVGRLPKCPSHSAAKGWGLQGSVKFSVMLAAKSNLGLHAPHTVSGLSRAPASLHPGV